MYAFDSPTNNVDPSGVDDCSVIPLSWLGCANNAYQGTVNWYNGLSPEQQDALKIGLAIGIGALAVLTVQPELFGLDAGLFGVSLEGAATVDLGGPLGGGSTIGALFSLAGPSLEIGGGGLLGIISFEAMGGFSSSTSVGEATPIGSELAQRGLVFQAR